MAYEGPIITAVFIIFLSSSSFVFMRACMHNKSFLQNHEWWQNWLYFTHFIDKHSKMPLQHPLQTRVMTTCSKWGNKCVYKYISLRSTKTQVGPMTLDQQEICHVEFCRHFLWLPQSVFDWILRNLLNRITWTNLVS